MNYTLTHLEELEKINKFIKDKENKIEDLKFEINAFNSNKVELINKILKETFPYLYDSSNALSNLYSRRNALTSEDHLTIAKIIQDFFGYDTLKEYQLQYERDVQLVEIKDEYNGYAFRLSIGEYFYELFLPKKYNSGSDIHKLQLRILLKGAKYDIATTMCNTFDIYKINGTAKQLLVGQFKNISD